MDPADLALRAAAETARQNGYPPNASNQHYNAAYSMQPPHPPHPYASHQGYASRQHMQHPGVAAANMAHPYGAMPPNGHPYRASPPNSGVMPHQQQMMRSSPYFNQSNAVPTSANLPGHTMDRYPPHTLQGHHHHQNGNRITLPPLGRNAINGTALGITGNANPVHGDLNSNHVGRFAGGNGTTVKSSNAQQHAASTSYAHGNAAAGNSLANSAFNQTTNTSAAGASTGSKTAGATAVSIASNNNPTHTLEPVTLPQPENEPEPPLPPMSKNKDPMKLHHHPDMPFLVTHWVDHYAAAGSSMGESNKVSGDEVMDSGEAKKKEALLRLQRAARDMAWAFETLGAYGDSGKELVSANNSDSARPTTYTDLKRKYSHLNQNTVVLLDSLVTASSSATNEASKSVLETVMPWSLLEAAYEGSVPTSNPGTLRDKDNANKQSSPLGAGRRVGDSVSDPTDESLENLLPECESAGSTLQNPVLMGGTASNSADQSIDYSSAADGALVMKLGSNFDTTAKKAAEASRKYLVARSKVHEGVIEFQKTRMAMQSAMSRAETAGSTLASVAARRSSDQFDPNSDLDQHRVIAQLERRLGDMHNKISSDKKQVTDAKKEADDAFQELSLIHGRYSDPYRSSTKSQFSMRCIGDRNILKPTSMRDGCLSRSCQNMVFVLPGLIKQQYQGRRRPTDFSHTQLSILKSRLSHAVTINCHLVYPVYCLKFDKTGKYFITGSDDQLVKLFHLGAGPKHGERPAGKQFSYGANLRGAVLVCTLRGHAGVVTDVDVSVDNAMLATASADGDVRVWGLRDGCPIAILRGHKGGANMVSWSLLTPYRLVSCGDDGLARMWDVRKAALKRYGDMVGNRTDYTLPDQKDSDHEDGVNNAELDSEMLPPVPMPQPNLADPEQGENAAVAGLLPDADGAAGNINLGNLNDNRGNPGDFVANDAIDEGVTLVARMQHGEIIRESQQGVGTRAQRKAVKVMCIARCPIGGHFATGSDDGKGRIWADSDDVRVESFDTKVNKSNDNASFPSMRRMFTREGLSERQKSILGSPTAPSKERLLATLFGHNNAITDVKYSNIGDRILTASMKDGIVRVWSWAKETPIVIDGQTTAASFSSDSNNNSTQAKFTNMTQLLIRLTPVHPNEDQETAQSSRRRGMSSNANTSSVHCDGVTWTCDDTKIVTSQSSPVKATGTEIVPGSHMIYVWDSISGRCLLGIYGSHTSLCSTLVPHPLIPSVVVSAGSDGIVNAWDLDKGERFCSHKNVLSYGPVENASLRGKQCSYLEGQFSPDGSYFVLSDEAGRVSVFDTVPKGESSTPPQWMCEQYFANDYYELFYDTNGYCIERGSERPPHLAPRGVRCNHEGVGIAESARGIFVNIAGPLVLSADSVRWSRNDIRSKHYNVHKDGGVLSYNVRKKATTLVESPGMLIGCRNTAIITPDGKLFEPSSKEKRSSAVTFGASNSGNRATGSAASGRALSSRYTWVDFNDIADEDIEEQYEDSDDEEYRADGRRLSGGREDDDHELSGVDSGGESEGESPVRSSQSRRRRQGQRRSTGQRSRQNRHSASESQEQIQPTRSSSRQTTRRTSQSHEYEEEDEFFEEVLSTHTKPSGEYAQDWLSADHFFKLPRDRDVNRKWLTRTNFQGSHVGTKAYCPQVGDSVVYIPRAHYDTLQRYPTGDNSGPWKSWPTHQPWPVVRCKVLGARYRFPYEMYYASSRRGNDGLKDVAVILTLEITGVPFSCDDRIFPWPAPVFTAPIASRTRSHDSSFEVTVFDSGLSDFIIPEFLYSWRIKGLEKAIVENDGAISNLSITINYPPDEGDPGYGREDPKYIPYEADIIDYAETYEDEFHFQCSGFNAITMKWTGSDDDEPIPVCAWEVQVMGMDAPKVPEMTADTRDAVNSALKQIMNSDPKVKEWFDSMPDTRIYSDYLLMIEVPMYLQRIRQRLQNKYYTTKNSVVKDMELIKENCYKYNEDNNDFYDLACEMHTKFKTLVDDIPDDPCAVNADESDQETIIRRGYGVARAANAASSGRQQRSPNRSRRRLSQQGHQSSLANLSQPDSMHRSLRRSTRETGAEGQDSSQQNRSTSRSARTVRSAAAVNTQDESQPTRASSRSIQRRTYTEEESDQDERSYTESEEEVQPTRSSRRSRNAQPTQDARASRTSSRVQRKATHKSDDDSEEDFDESPSPVRATRRQTRAAVSSPNRCTRSVDNRRLSARRGLQHEDMNEGENSDDYSEASAQESDGSEESPTPKKQAKIRARVGRNTNSRSSRSSPEKQSSPENARSSSRTRTNVSYAEIGSEEEEYYDEESFGDGSDVETPPKRKRLRNYDDEKETPQKKRARASANQSRLKRGQNSYPELTRWPDISKRYFQKVGHAVINALMEQDEDGLFAAPVTEMYPEWADNYLSIITDPMDFRTIQEIRLSQYQHIHELQDDLILTFKNCCVFNGADSEFYESTIQIWQSLNEVFIEACDENHVTLPNNFS